MDKKKFKKKKKKRPEQQNKPTKISGFDFGAWDKFDVVREYLISTHRICN